MAELADAVALGATVLETCRFESCPRHHTQPTPARSPWPRPRPPPPSPCARPPRRQARWRALVSVEVSAERVGRAFDRAYRDLARRAQVKGFRPGKVPRSVLERLYGPAVRRGRRAQPGRRDAPRGAGAGRGRAGGRALDRVAASRGGRRLPLRGARRGEAARSSSPELCRADGQAARRRGAARPRSTGSSRRCALRRAPLVDEPAGTPIADGHFVTARLRRARRRPSLRRRLGAGRDASRSGSGIFPPASRRRSTERAPGEDREVRVAHPRGRGLGRGRRPRGELRGPRGRGEAPRASRRSTTPSRGTSAASRASRSCASASASDLPATEANASPGRGCARASWTTLLARVEFPVPPGLVAAPAPGAPRRWPTGSSRARCPTTSSTRASTPGARSGVRPPSATSARSCCSRPSARRGASRRTRTRSPRASTSSRASRAWTRAACGATYEERGHAAGAGGRAAPREGPRPGLIAQAEIEEVAQARPHEIAEAAPRAHIAAPR